MIGGSEWFKRGACGIELRLVVEFHSLVATSLLSFTVCLIYLESSCTILQADCVVLLLSRYRQRLPMCP